VNLPCSEFENFDKFLVAMKNSLLTAKRIDHSLSAGKIHRRSRIDHHMKIVPSKNKPPFLSSPDVLC